MGTVVIGGNNYTIYGDETGANAYWLAGLGTIAAAWAAASAPTKDAALVQATRMLDRQHWQGTSVGTPVIDVTLQWPRSGVVDQDGNPVSSGSVPDLIIKGAYELAGQGLVDPSIFTGAMSGSNVKRVDAGGGVGVEFFVPTLNITGRFPASVQEMVGQFLDGATDVAGSQAFGTTSTDQYSTSSTFGDDVNFDITRGL